MYGLDILLIFAGSGGRQTAPLLGHEYETVGVGHLPRFASLGQPKVNIRRT